jgi:hypothetical protein
MIPHNYTADTNTQAHKEAVLSERGAQKVALTQVKMLKKLNVL